MTLRGMNRRNMLGLGAAAGASLVGLDGQALAQSVAPGNAAYVRQSPLVLPPASEAISVWISEMRKAQTPSPAINYEFAMELPILAEELAYMSLITCAGLPTSIGVPGIQAAMAPIGALADLDSIAAMSQVNWSNGLLNTILTDFPAFGSADQRNFFVNDQYNVTPVARTDGGTRALVAGRVWLTSSANIMTLGTTGDNFDAWATRSAGLVRLRSNPSTSSALLTNSGWSAAETNIIVGFAYGARGKTFTIARVGDSISNGRQIDYPGSNFSSQAIEALNIQNATTGIRFSDMNLAWSGSYSVNYIANFWRNLNAPNALIPDAAAFPLISPNDAPTTITSTIVAAWDTGIDQFLSYCSKYRITPILWTGLPVSSSVFAWGSTDSLRVAHNNKWLAIAASRGFKIYDASAVFSGSTDGTGQVQPVPAYTTDGIHPNAAGNAAIALVAQPVYNSLTVNF